MSCETAYFAGLSDILCKLGKINGVMLSEKGTTFTDATFVTESVHHLNIASVTTASRNSMPFRINSFENTTDDVNITTSALGHKMIDGKPIPSALVKLKMNACDYQTLYPMEGKYYEATLFTDEKVQMGTRTATNTVKGFRCTVGFKAGLPPEAAQDSFEMYLFFEIEDEFRNVVYARPDYRVSTLTDFVPVGLNLTRTTDYATGTSTAIYKVTQRGSGLGETGGVAADFEILESDGTALVATTSIVDNGLGSYDVLIKADSAGTPVALAAGNYYRMQMSKDDGTYVTYISNVVKEIIA